MKRGSGCCTVNIYCTAVLTSLSVTSDFHETLQGRSAGVYLQIHRRDFRYLLPRYYKKYEQINNLNLASFIRPLGSDLFSQYDDHERNYKPENDMCFSLI